MEINVIDNDLNIRELKYLKENYNGYRDCYNISNNYNYNGTASDLLYNSIYMPSNVTFNNIGLIKLLELTDGLQSLIVDGSYLYWLHNGTTSVVGEWDYTTGNLIINADIQKSLARNDIFKQLKNNITLLNGHKHLMIPYNLSPLNKINVKEKKK